MFYRIIAAIVIGLVCLSSIAQQKEQRVALVIGNSSYKASPLKNPVNDARDMANSLRGYGFTVIERTNLTTRQVGSTLRDFRSKLTPGSVAVVFYAGHGVQIKGENYLPTVDAEINGEEDVPMQSLSTRQVMDILSEAKTRMNLVFLDACRDNPYARSFRSGSRGIAKENAPSGTLISFATRPGSVAGDGDGRNGLYTSVLLEQIKQSNQPIEQVLKRVVSGVKGASKGQQEPWMEGSIEGDFCFGQCGLTNHPIGVSNTVPRAEQKDPDEEAWEIAKRNNTLYGYQDFSKTFPNSRFKQAANVAISSLSRRDGSSSDVLNPNTNKHPAAAVENLAGTTWEGIDGAKQVVYEVTFLNFGIFRYKSKSVNSNVWGQTFDNGTWNQNGLDVYIETNSRYSERFGRIDGAVLSGTGKNTAGSTWKFEYKLKN